MKETSESIVLAAVDDLFFMTKIADAARRMGIRLVQAHNAQQLAEQLDLMTPGLVILDLNSKACSPLEAIRRIKADARFQGSPVVGFLSHVYVELEEAARAAGCDHVIPRSRFSANLPQILQMNRPSHA